jgi:molecular chaperone GrpE
VHSDPLSASPDPGSERPDPADVADDAPNGTSSPEAPSADELAELVALEPVDGAVHAQTLAERDDYLDSLRRLQADFENYRKRSIRDQDAAADRACEKIVAKLLPVLDTVELAVAHDSAGGQVDKLGEALLAALQSEGLERIAPEVGAPFDPQTAEAVLHENADGGEPVIAQVLRAGFTWRSRVMRPAMVKVSG